MQLPQLISATHRRVELFFEAQAKQATPLSAIALLLLAALLYSVAFAITAHGNGDGGWTWNWTLTEKNPSVILNDFVGQLLWVVLNFGISSLFAWQAGLQWFKNKAAWYAVTHNLNWTRLFFAIMAYFGILAPRIFPPLGNLTLPFLLLVPYFSVVALKAVHRTGYFQAFALVVVSYLAPFVLMTAVFAQLYLALVVPSIHLNNTTDSVFYFNITNHTDGSFTVLYAWVHNKTGQTEKACELGFPSGWTMADNKTIRIFAKIERPWDNASRYSELLGYYKIASINSSTPEYFFFTLPAPIWMGEGFNEAKRYREMHPYPSQESVDVFITNSTGLQILDIKTSSRDRSLVHHEITVRSMDGVGFEASYWSPYGHDQDVSYTINATRCYAG